MKGERDRMGDVVWWKTWGPDRYISFYILVSMRERENVVVGYEIDYGLVGRGIVEWLIKKEEPVEMDLDW